MATTKVAIVTGSNKGLGFGIVKGLCQNFDGDVFVTARNVSRGEAAIEQLKKEGYEPKFHQLDIDHHDSILKLYTFIKEKYGGLDLLVNNAGVDYVPTQGSSAFCKEAELCVKTNFWSTLDVCTTLFPLLRPHARVVNVASELGQTALMKLSQQRKNEVLGTKTIDDIKSLMTEFHNDSKAGVQEDKGWQSLWYGMSKLGMIVLSSAQQVLVDSQGFEDVVVNAVCPGYVATDMTNHQGHLTIEQGAETPLYAALLAPNVKEPRGKFLIKKKVVQLQ